MSYFPRLSGTHRLHFLFLEPGLTIRMYGGHDPGNLLSVNTVLDASHDWGAAGMHENDTRTTADALSRICFSSHFSGRIQFPSAEEFHFRIEGDPDATIMLKIDGVIVFTTGFAQDGSQYTGPRVSKQCLLLEVLHIALESFTCR